MRKGREERDQVYGATIIIALVTNELKVGMVGGKKKRVLRREREFSS